MPTPKLSDAKRARVLSLHGLEIPVSEVARRAGVSIGTVGNVWKAAGLLSPRRAKANANHRKVHEEQKKGGSFREVAQRVGIGTAHTCTLSKTPLPPEPIKPAGKMPKAITRRYEPYTIDREGHWGIIGDLHIPEHDETTIELFIAECKRRNVKGIILNGDILDSHEVSDHDHDPSALRYVEEIERGKEFLGYLREQFPKAEIVYKHGNHEERVHRYLAGRAPAIEGLEGLNIRSWLHFQDFGIDEVKDRRIIQLGSLFVVHAHEFRGQGGVTPARWLYLRARVRALCHHFHRTSEHHARNIAMKYEAAWSVGCACFLHPYWLSINEWNHGFAMVDVDKSGDFSVENKRVIAGKVV